MIDVREGTKCEKEKRKVKLCFGYGKIILITIIHVNNYPLKIVINYW